MKVVVTTLLVSVLALPMLAQTVVPSVPGQPVSGDSVGRAKQPGVVRIGTDFYRRAGDPPNVIRATLDNMPVRSFDQSYNYPMPNPGFDRPNRYSMPGPDELRPRFRRFR